MDEITLRITGMTCASCLRHVDRALRGVEGAHDVRVSLREGAARVRRDPAASDEALLEAVREAGYGAARAA